MERQYECAWSEALGRTMEHLRFGGRAVPVLAYSVRLAEALRTRGVDVRLDLWEGWAHDWPYWKEMTRAYLP